MAASPPSTSTTPTPSSTDNHHIIEELEKVRNELAQTKLKLAEQNKQLHVVQKVHCSQQVDVIPVANVATMTENLIEEKRVESSSDKENVHPDIICIEDAGYKARIQDLQQEIAFLKVIFFYNKDLIGANSAVENFFLRIENRKIRKRKFSILQ